MIERRARHASKMVKESHDVSILDEDNLSDIDTFEVVLLRICRWTLIPEILEAFGPENTLKFLDIFKGTTIKVPSASIIAEAARDTVIYSMLGPNPKDRDVVSYLAKRFDLSQDDVWAIYSRVKGWRDLTQPSAKQIQDQHKL